MNKKYVSPINRHSKLQVYILIHIHVLEINLTFSSISGESSEEKNVRDVT